MSPHWTPASLFYLLFRKLGKLRRRNQETSFTLFIAQIVILDACFCTSNTRTGRSSINIAVLTILMSMSCRDALLDQVRTLYLLSGSSDRHIWPHSEQVYYRRDRPA